MNKFIDLTGERFGRLTVISRAENSKSGDVMWNCICDCGTKKTIKGGSLKQGLTVSCGCYHKDVVSKGKTTHGMSKSRLFHEWQYIKRRCYNKNYRYYDYYGGRGITVCKEWKDNFESFRDWALQNGYTDDLTLDRIDPDGNYSPDNCRWVTRKTQQRNRRCNHYFTINGETKNLSEWCEIYDVPHERTRRRIVNEGWDVEKALTTPPLNRNGQPR